MKRLFLIMAILVIIVSIFASQPDPRKALPYNEGNLRPVQQKDRFMPSYSFAIEPISIIDNFYDYFPGSYSGKPVQRVSTPTFDGNWLIFHSKPTSNSTRRVYKTFIDNTGEILTNGVFGTTDTGEGYPGMATTAGGRPILAYHVNIDADPDLEVGFGYDAVIGGVAFNMNSDLYQLIDNAHPIEVNGQVITTNDFHWPSVQIGPSPIEGSQRVYIMARNGTTNGSAVAENVIVYYNDFTENEIENQVFDNEGWSYTSIPELDEWNNSMGEWRRPFMSFIVHNDKLYYIGYHIAYTQSGAEGSPLEEGCTTAFVCDNYGEGAWTQHSIYNEFDVANPKQINPLTGEIVPGTGIFVDSNNLPYADEFVRMGIGQSSNFSTSIDNEGRIHFPIFYTVISTEGGYWPDFHTVKHIAFDTNTLNWELSEVYPQVDNGTNVPNDPINITNYDGANDGCNEGTIWLSWDQDGDGLHDQVYDDGTWDGIDDGVTVADADIWGVAVRDNRWPYMYWDNEAAEGSMMFHLHTAHITEGNEEGMMAMVWQDAQKSRDYNKYPDSYPELAPYQNMCELAISVSADNGRHWSETLFLNGVDNPEMQGQIPEFPYLSNKVDYIGFDENGNKIGRLYIMYLNDYTYGSSIQNIGQATGGSMQFMAIDVVFTDAPTDNVNNDVAPTISMLSQNYPNPFNPETKISFNVIKTGKVELSIYNVKGQLVKTLVNENKAVGMHNIVWHGDNNNGKKVSSGVYYYRLKNAGKTEMKKMVLMK